ncbi:hypothetical protein ABBQ32_010898 [Trebouxia sp. C0010 RCD-2024]
MALKQGRSIPLLEDIDPDYEPSSEEIADYAQWLGLDLEAEKDLVWICREGLKAKLPADWKAFRTADDGEVYYYNAASGDSSWEHPCDERFMKLYADEKAKLVARRKTHEQASSTGAQPVKPKPGVLPPLQLAPLGGKAALPPLSKAPLQQAQPVLSSTPLQPSNSISSAPATPMSAQGVLKPLKQPLDAPASAKSRSSLPKGPLGEPVMESIRSEKQSRAVPSNQDVKADTQKAKLDSEGRLAAMRRELLAAEDRERAELEREYRDRLEALRMELAQQEEQAKQQSAGRLQNLAAEASRLEASARQEGEARCAAVQAQNLTKLTALQQQQQDSDVQLAELKQQHNQLQAQLQQQVGELLAQQQDQQQQQKLREEALASLRASIQEQLRPQKQLLHDEALAALQSDVSQQVQGQRQQLEQAAVSRMQQEISDEVEARRKQLQDAALVAMRSEVVAEVTNLRNQELEQALQQLRQQLQQQVSKEHDQQLSQLKADMAERLILNRQRLEEEHAKMLEVQAQESRLKAQDAVREDEGKWVEQERKLMERRVKHQVQAEEAALLAVDMAAAERRIHSALNAHISELRQQIESEERAEVSEQIKLQMAEEKAAKLAAARLQMEQEVADAIAQQTAQTQSQADSAQQPARSEPQHAAAESPQVSPEARAAESQSQLLREIRDFVKMAREGIKQRQVALQYARSSWQACLNERPSEGLGEVLGGLRGVMEAEGLQLNTETQALHALKAHVKAVERGHPLAAQRAAASRPASPLLFPSAHPSMYQPFSGPMGGYAHGLSGEAAPMGAQSWGGVDGMGKNAPEKIRVYSPSGSKGLDSIGQALSAALKACESRRHGTGLGPVNPAWAISSYSTPSRHMYTPAHMLPTSRGSIASHAQHSRPETAQDVLQNHARWLRSFNAQMYT